MKLEKKLLIIIMINIFPARLTQANLVTKTDFDDKLKNSNRKINSNKTNHLIAEIELKVTDI